MRNESLDIRLLNVNGETHKVCFPHNETLLETLRYRLDLVGTKQGCDKGDCGACTVLINGAPTLSCLSLAGCVNEKDRITTIEGLVTKGIPDLLLLAFLKCGALQCGFCQPGMILSAKALLEKNNKPELRDIKEALSGNLCRCTGYTKIYLAVFCASLVVSKEAKDLDEALLIMRENKSHLGDA